MLEIGLKKIHEEFIVESMFKIAVTFLIPSSISIFILQICVIKSFRKIAFDFLNSALHNLIYLYNLKYSHLLAHATYLPTIIKLNNALGKMT